MRARWLSLCTILLLALAAASPSALAAPALPINTDPQYGSNEDDAHHPLGDKQRKDREQGFEAKVSGETHGDKHRVGHGQYVELDRTGEDTIWTIIGEFGNLIDTHYSSIRPSRSV
jgi:immune inhibitor A